jgi:hypothetical protein
VSRKQAVEPGNIVTMDPIYAYFDVDERTMLRVRKMIREKLVTDTGTLRVHGLFGNAGRMFRPASSCGPHSGQRRGHRLQRGLPGQHALL